MCASFKGKAPGHVTLAMKHVLVAVPAWSAPAASHLGCLFLIVVILIAYWRLYFALLVRDRQTA
jgi:hypothetical protein